MTGRLFLGTAADVTERLRRERKRHGWSLAQFAERLTEAGWAVGSGTLSKLENGRPGVALRVDHLAAITRVLDISADELLTPIEVLDSDETERVSSLIEVTLSGMQVLADALQAYLTQAESLPDAARDLVLAWARHSSDLAFISGVVSGLLEEAAA